jgi:hypothetical protein
MTIPSASKEEEKLDQSYIADGNINVYGYSGKLSGHFL